MANLYPHEVDKKLLTLIDSVNRLIDGSDYDSVMTVLLTTMVMVATTTNDTLEEAIEDIDSAHDMMISNATANWPNVLKMRVKN